MVVELRSSRISGVSEGITGVPWAITNSGWSGYATKEKEKKTQVFTGFVLLLSYGILKN